MRGQSAAGNVRNGGGKYRLNSCSGAGVTWRPPPLQVRKEHMTELKPTEDFTKELTKELTKEFTKSETAILDYYRSLNERFCRSLLTIARATGCGTATVQRANSHFQRLGILSWIRGNGNRVAGMPCHPNQYRLTLQ